MQKSRAFILQVTSYSFSVCQDSLVPQPWRKAQASKTITSSSEGMLWSDSSHGLPTVAKINVSFFRQAYVGSAQVGLGNRLAPQKYCL